MQDEDEAALLLRCYAYRTALLPRVFVFQVTSYSLSLREIDTVQDEDEAAGPDGGYVPNALEAVLRKRHLDMLQVGLGV